MATKLGTAFEILELFMQRRIVRLTLVQIASRVGCTKSTASETCRDLADEGYLSRLGGGASLEYVMGPKFQQAFADSLFRDAAENVRAAKEIYERVRSASRLLAEAAEIMQPVALTPEDEEAAVERERRDLDDEAPPVDGDEHQE